MAVRLGFLVFLLYSSLCASANNSINMAKSINKICSIYATIRQSACENIADEVINKFEYGKYDNQEALKESCIFQCEMARSNKQLSQGLK